MDLMDLMDAMDAMDIMDPMDPERSRWRASGTKTRGMAGESPMIQAKIYPNAES
jgi:hypothetical protein